MANPILNLADFKAEYKLNKALQSLTNLIAGAQQPNGQPIFPNEPGTPLNDIIRQYNLQPAEAPPPYDFGLDNHVTIEAIKAECIQRNVNFFDVTNTHGNRQFYDITYTVTKPNDAIAFLRVVPWVFPFICNNFFFRYVTCL